MSQPAMGNHSLRNQALEFLREIFEPSALDRFIQGVEDPRFDPDVPYRGRLVWDQLSETARMTFELVEHQMDIMSRYYDYAADESFLKTKTLVEDAYSIARVTLAPSREVFRVDVANVPL